MAAKVKHVMRKVDDGYEYRGRVIYRWTNKRGGYNPWRVNMTRQTFSTRSEARDYIDSVVQD